MAKRKKIPVFWIIIVLAAVALFLHSEGILGQTGGYITITQATLIGKEPLLPNANQVWQIDVEMNGMGDRVQDTKTLSEGTKPITISYDLVEQTCAYNLIPAEEIYSVNAQPCNEWLWDDCSRACLSDYAYNANPFAHVRPDYQIGEMGPSGGYCLINQEVAKRGNVVHTRINFIADVTFTAGDESDTVRIDSSSGEMGGYIEINGERVAYVQYVGQPSGLGVCPSSAEFDVKAMYDYDTGQWKLTDERAYEKYTDYHDVVWYETCWNTGSITSPWSLISPFNPFINPTNAKSISRMEQCLDFIEQSTIQAKTIQGDFHIEGGTTKTTGTSENNGKVTIDIIGKHVAYPKLVAYVDSEWLVDPGIYKPVGGKPIVSSTHTDENGHGTITLSVQNPGEELGVYWVSADCGPNVYVGTSSIEVPAEGTRTIELPYSTEVQQEVQRMCTGEVYLWGHYTPEYTTTWEETITLKPVGGCSPNGKQMCEVKWRKICENGLWKYITPMCEIDCILDSAGNAICSGGNTITQCGNGVCEQGETSANCPVDCGCQFPAFLRSAPPECELDWMMIGLALGAILIVVFLVSRKPGRGGVAGVPSVNLGDMGLGDL